MAGMFLNIFAVILAAAFAIGSIVGIFTLASWAFNEIVTQFQRSMVRGLGALLLTLASVAAMVFAARAVTPYVTAVYREML